MFYRNGNFNSYGGKKKYGSGQYNNKYDNDNDDNDYRKKRQYSYNPTDVQVPTVSIFKQQRVFTPPPQQQQYQTSYNPIQMSSYGPVQQQQSRLLLTQTIPQLPAQRMLF